MFSPKHICRMQWKDGCAKCGYLFRNVKLPKKILCRNLNIAIEGNIGSGKSTLLQHIQQTYGSKVQVFQEPLELWQNVNGVNLCDRMYKNSARWGFTFQNYVQLTLINMHQQMQKAQEEQPDRINLIERSILSARYVFVENLRSRGLLDNAEYRILDDFFKLLVSQNNISIDLIVYLRIEPEKCLERIQKRGRPEENQLKLEDLKILNDLHERWLNNHVVNLNIPVFEIYSNDSKDNFFDLIDHTLGKIADASTQIN